MKKTLDLGSENINKLLLSFAIPCIISMLINSIYNIVDQIFIGQGVGYLGNAATNVIFPLVIITNAFAGLLGNGCAANFSLRLGEGKKQEAGGAIGSTIFFTFIFSFAFSLILYLLLPILINLFGCTSNVYPYAIAYGKIILIGSPFMIITSVLSSIIRADGSPKYSMIALSVGAIINIILDAIFILKLNMGVKGGALATIIGQFVSCIITLFYLNKFKCVKITKKDYHLNKKIFKIMAMGLSSFITQTTVLALFIFMNNIMTHYGALSEFGSDIPLSVYGILSKLNSIYIGFVLGMSIGSQPIIGYNYGAGNYDRVKQTLKKVLIINFTIGIIYNITILLFPKTLISLFGSADNELYLKFAIDCFRILSLVCALNAFEMTSSIVIQSLGKVKKATTVSFIRQIILFIPIALLLTSKMGLYGALYAGAISDFICFIIVIFIFGSEYKKISNKTQIEDINIEIEKQEVKQLDHKVIITINREYGSGGRYVGKMLAQSLNIDFYDKEIITLASLESGLSEDFIKTLEQQKQNTISTDYNSADEIFIAEAKVIKQIAKSSCVIVGRCADYILKDYDNVIKIFLYSSEDKKIERIVKHYNIKLENAKGQMNKIDKQRAQHYKHYTGQKWRDLSHYDIAINVDSLGVIETSKMLQNMIINRK